jgi:phenylalanyl-tRNA synthetase alpha chain
VLEKIEEIRQKLAAELAAAETADDIEKTRISFLGRKGLLRNLKGSFNFAEMKQEERSKIGALFNDLKAHIETEIKAALARAGSGIKTAQTAFDLTLPGTTQNAGSLHPITLVQAELEEIFTGMGFSILTGWEVEREVNNFDFLNIPADHPARDMQDTFWLDNGMVMRTHTSANQVPALRKLGVPIRAVFPGRCFRYESVDATHENTFYQVEGLMVDREITVANLIAVMRALLREVFRQDVTVRLRPGYFPFVEPGFELDIRCLLCAGKGCSTCKTGWIELIPCGLVHPRVLEHGGVDPDVYSGFAFGLGLTRLAMMKYGIPEIRLFNSGDIRFLEQFPASVEVMR